MASHSPHNQPGHQVEIRPSDISSALGAVSGLRPFSGLVLGVDGWMFSGRVEVEVGGGCRAVFSYRYFFWNPGFFFMGWNPRKLK